MPMYDFHCDGCGAELEELTRTGAPGPACPACGEPMRRLVGAVAIRPAGIAAEVAPAVKRSRPDDKPKRSDREVIDRVAQRIVRESQKPGHTPVTHEQAREKARAIRHRKVRDGRG